MNAGQTTKRFLATLDTATQNTILGSIAKHYATNVDAIRAEVTDDDAKQLLEYMVEPERSATRVLMQRAKLAA
jgi:hypothetical protein